MLIDTKIFYCSGFDKLNHQDTLNKFKTPTVEVGVFSLPYFILEV